MRSNSSRPRHDSFGICTARELVHICIDGQLTDLLEWLLTITFKETRYELEDMSYTENPHWMFVLDRLYRNSLVMEYSELRDQALERGDELRDRWQSRNSSLYSIEDLPELFQTEARFARSLKHLEAAGAIERIESQEDRQDSTQLIRLTELGLQVVHEADIQERRKMDKDRRKQRENRLTAEAGYLTVVLALATASPGVITAFVAANLPPIFPLVMAGMAVLAPILFMSDIVKGKILNQWP